MRSYYKQQTKAGQLNFYILATGDTADSSQIHRWYLWGKERKYEAQNRAQTQNELFYFHNERSLCCL